MSDQGISIQEHYACLEFPWLLFYGVLCSVVMEPFLVFMTHKALLRVSLYFFILENFGFTSFGKKKKLDVLSIVFLRLLFSFTQLECQSEPTFGPGFSPHQCEELGFKTL